MAAAIEIDTSPRSSSCTGRRPQSAKERVIQARPEPLRAVLRARRRVVRGRRGRDARRCSATTARASRRCSSAWPAPCARPRGASPPGGRLAALLELGAGFHPDLTGRENVYLNGSILGLLQAAGRRASSTTSSTSPSSHEFIDMQVSTTRRACTPGSGSPSRSTSSPTSCSSTRCCRSATRRSSASASSGSAVPARGPHDPRSSATRPTWSARSRDRAAVFDHGHLVEVGDAGDAIRTFRESLDRAHEIHGETAAAADRGRPDHRRATGRRRAGRARRRP